MGTDRTKLHSTTCLTPLYINATLKKLKQALAVDSSGVMATVRTRVLVDSGYILAKP